LRTSLLLIAASVLLSGCLTTKGGLACDGWKPIRPTKADVERASPQLVDGVLAHNQFGASLGCWKR
jgi:hypothetical protein